MIDFTNFRDHPSKAFVEIFYYYQKERADFMEELLINSEIKYERGEEIDENKEVPVYYFLVSKREHKAIMHLNNITIGKFRKPFIPDKYLRFFLLVFSTLIMTLALIGYFKTTNR